MTDTSTSHDLAEPRRGLPGLDGWKEDELRDLGTRLLATIDARDAEIRALWRFVDAVLVREPLLLNRWSVLARVHEAIPVRSRTP